MRFPTSTYRVAAILFTSCVVFQLSCKKKDDPDANCTRNNSVKDSICSIKTGSVLFHGHVSYYSIGHLHPSSPPADQDLPDTYFTVKKDKDIITVGEYSFQYSQIDTAQKYLLFINTGNYIRSYLRYYYQTGSIHFGYTTESGQYGTSTGYWTP